MTLDDQSRNNLIEHRMAKAYEAVQQVENQRFGQFIRDAFDSRSVGDYDDWAEFSNDDVMALFDGMKEFITEMERLIRI
jgi:uncharacterized protein (UPF0332 family)